MRMQGHIWEGGDDGHLTKVDITIERTDVDEVAIFGRPNDLDSDAEATIYVSVDTALRVAVMLGIAALANEIQAHEAAMIADRSE